MKEGDCKANGATVKRRPVFHLRPTPESFVLS